MAETVVNENSASFHTVNFADVNSSGESPASARYDLHDGYDGSTIAGSSIASPSSSVTINISHIYNAIRHGLRYERRVLTVQSNDGSGWRQVDQQTYLVKNLYMVESTST